MDLADNQTRQSNEQQIITTIIIIIVSRIRGNVTSREELRKLPSCPVYFFFSSLMLLAWVSIALHCNRRRKAYTYFYLIGIFKRNATTIFASLGTSLCLEFLDQLFFSFFFFKFRRRKHANLPVIKFAIVFTYYTRSACVSNHFGSSGSHWSTKICRGPRTVYTFFFHQFNVTCIIRKDVKTIFIVRRYDD